MMKKDRAKEIRQGFLADFISIALMGILFLGAISMLSGCAPAEVAAVSEGMAAVSEGMKAASETLDEVSDGLQAANEVLVAVKEYLGIPDRPVPTPHTTKAKATLAEEEPYYPMPFPTPDKGPAKDPWAREYENHAPATTFSDDDSEDEWFGELDLMPVQLSEEELAAIAEASRKEEVRRWVLYTLFLLCYLVCFCWLIYYSRKQKKAKQKESSENSSSDLNQDLG